MDSDELSIERIQAYLRHSARSQYQMTPAPPFSVFIDTNDAFKYFNYAIPDERLESRSEEDLSEALQRMESIFIAAGRQPRLEYIEQFAPKLGAALERAGYELEGRTQLMVVTPDDYQPAKKVEGLEIHVLDEHSPNDRLRDFLNTQRQGFNPGEAEPATVRDVGNFLPGFRDGLGILGVYEGQPVATALLTAPFDGISEVSGIATLPPYRRRGVATALTGAAAERAFQRGVSVLCLTAADEAAGRVYQAIGFRPYATALAYSRDIG